MSILKYNEQNRHCMYTVYIHLLKMDVISIFCPKVTCYIFVKPKFFSTGFQNNEVKNNVCTNRFLFADTYIILNSKQL